jgi:hypothetical protein
MAPDLGFLHTPTTRRPSRAPPGPANPRGVASDRQGRDQGRVRQLEKGPSESLGETAWKESGLDASADFYGVQSSATTRRSVPGAMRSMAGMTFV